MKKQIVQVSVLQSAKVASVIYLVTGIPAAFLVWIGARMMNQAFSLFMFILLPIMYALIGFVFSAIGCWIYNLIASQVGGFEYTTEEVSTGLM